MSAGNGVNPRRRRSTRPYRDSAFAYGVLGSLVVIFAYVTGSSLLRSVAGGLAAFLLATGYTWWRVRARQRQEERDL
ncbi:MAG TPA: hypothetical protein VLK24_00955 [Gaiellaceae bacterium]|nr:hypothetical protein [Gaiellaceae bacterium]